MFTPAITAFGSQSTPLLPAPRFLQSIAQTTLTQAFRRDDPPAILTNAQTCGYTSGAWSSAVTCGPSKSCTYYTTPYSAPNFGCCSEGADCDYVSTCLDYKARGNSNTYQGVMISGAQFLCGSDLAYCSTMLLFGTTYAPGSSYSFMSYACQAKSGTTVTGYQTTMQDTSATSSSSIATTSGSSESKDTEVSTTSSSPSASTDAISVSVMSSSSVVPAEIPSDPTPATATSSSTQAHEDLPMVSQIGIGIGVSVGVGIMLAAFAFWLFHHKKAKAANDWNNQTQQPFGNLYSENSSGKPAQFPDYRSNSFLTHSSAKTGGAEPAAYELTSTPRRHELAGNDF